MLEVEVSSIAGALWLASLSAGELLFLLITSSGPAPDPSSVPATVSTVPALVLVKFPSVPFISAASKFALVCDMFPVLVPVAVVVATTN